MLPSGCDPSPALVFMTARTMPKKRRTLFFTKACRPGYCCRPGRSEAAFLVFGGTINTCHPVRSRDDENERMEDDRPPPHQPPPWVRRDRLFFGTHLNTLKRVQTSLPPQLVARSNFSVENHLLASLSSYHSFFCQGVLPRAIKAPPVPLFFNPKPLQTDGAPGPRNCSITP